MDSNYYKFTNKAMNDLDSIVKYISIDLHNSLAAKNFFTRVFENLERLCSFPESCSEIENEYIKTKDIRKMIIDNYLLIYKYLADDNCVVVLRIIYAKRDTSEILKSFDFNI